MSAFHAFVEEVRSRSDIVEVIGADVALRPCGKVLKGLSPFNHETNPSFVVWPANQSWHDFSKGGGRGGDVFAYVQERDRCGFKEALAHLTERAGLRRPGQGEAEHARELELHVEQREVRRLLTRAAAHYHRVLPSKIREEWYREHYGFTDDTIDRLLLGWADGHLYEELVCEPGVTRTLALKTGLFVAAGPHVHDFFHDRLVFPYWKRGEVVYFIARATEYTADEPWEQAKYKKLLTHSEKHPYVSPSVGNDHFYNEDAARGTEEILITEGVTDCISAVQAGIACISPVTTRFRERDVPKLVSLTRHVKRIVICNDSETSGAGEAGALHTAAALHREGRDVRIATLPRPEGVEKIDVNEFLKAHSADDLRAVLAAAPRYVHHLLARIPAETPPSELGSKLVPVLAAVTVCPPIERDSYVEAIAKRFGIKRRTLAELAAKARAPAKRGDRQGEPGGPRPQIVARVRQLREVVADAWQAVLAANDPPRVFARGGQLVRIRRDETGARVESLDEAAAYGLLARVADWVYETEEAVVPVFPPREAARDVLAYPSASLPRLDEVLLAPVFGHSGQVLDKPGYHASDAVWIDLADNVAVDPVPTIPSEQDVAAARALLFDELLVDFPFADDSDRAHMIAALLLPFARRLMSGSTPIHLVEAPVAGTGKGLLVSVLFLLATGRGSEAGTLPGDEEEVRKKITSELLAGRAIIALDNADPRRRLDSSALASVTTADHWVDRLLGQSRSVTLPNRALWVLTGNNVRLSTELARRCVRIRIDARTDRPWRRDGFRHPDLLRWTREHRGVLIHAALTLVQAWVARGRPLGTERLGSFETWAEVMGGVLATAGVPGFLGNLEALHELADEEGALWRELVDAWWWAHQDRPVRVTELVELCRAGELMVPVLGDGTERSQAVRLGNALKVARDRVHGDYRVCAVRDRHVKQNQYRLERVEGTR